MRQLGYRILDAVAVQHGRTEQERLPILVIENQLPVLWLRRWLCRPEYFVEAELRGLPDHLDCLTRILDIGKLDDDSAIASTGQRRLRDSKCVHSSTQNLQRPIRRFRISFDTIGVLGL